VRRVAVAGQVDEVKAELARELPRRSDATYGCPATAGDCLFA
jgi:hypothetical protein